MPCSIKHLAASGEVRDIKDALQTAGFQPAYAQRGEELNPKRLKDWICADKKGALNIMVGKQQKTLTELKLELFEGNMKT